jgi:hypothetical protein
MHFGNYYKRYHYDKKNNLYHSQAHQTYQTKKMNSNQARQNFKEYRYVKTLETRIQKLQYYYDQSPKNSRVYNEIIFLRRRLRYLNDYYSGSNKYNITSSLIHKIQHDINKLKPIGS